MEIIQRLSDEIARLKGNKPKLKIKPGKMEEAYKDIKRLSRKCPGSFKERKPYWLMMYEMILIKPENIPDGSKFKGYKQFIAQGLKIEPHNIRIIKMEGMAMNPLCVTATTCDLSGIGRKNIDNIKNLGVDYIEVSPNPVVRRKMNRIGLAHVGDISWLEHVAIFTIPVRIALQINVLLLIWGESSSGSPEENHYPPQGFFNGFHFTLCKESRAKKGYRQKGQ